MDGLQHWAERELRCRNVKTLSDAIASAESLDDTYGKSEKNFTKNRKKGKVGERIYPTTNQRRSHSRPRTREGPRMKHIEVGSKREPGVSVAMVRMPSVIAHECRS